VAERGEHWESIYATAPSTQVSWYEREPATSLRLVEEVASGLDAAVIDIGAGASLLVDRLLVGGFRDVTVLDISHHALDEVGRRLGDQARRVTFIAEDVLMWEPDRQYEIWHDRAVFHFLTEPLARDRYIDLAARSIRSGGALVLATFAEDGPAQCSGLPVSRYSAEGLEDAFSLFFTLIHDEREEHTTPGGVVQPFTWVVFRRTSQP
jgi:2-polyprenyl-3-methyl-5-hydroxy-6-metoxy-1,4-benzoquinol methylase